MEPWYRRADFGSLLFGVIVLLVGGFYFLRNTLGFQLGEIDWDLIWPIFVLALGVAILAGAFRRSRHEPKA
jgi:hypothetical protein